MRGRFAVLDLDGCLIPGRGEAANLDPLTRLRALSLRHGGRLFTFATGRAAMYALAMAQLLGVEATVAAEHGALLLDPVRLSLTWTVPEEGRRWPEVQAAIMAAVDDLLPDVAVEPGKMATVSLHPRNGDVDGLLSEVRRRLDGLPVHANRSSLAVDIVGAGADKGRALAVLAAEAGLPTQAVLAVGDSLGDLPMLTAAGFAACPANAAAVAKEAVAAHGGRGYPSTEPFAAGVLDALRWYLRPRPARDAGREAG